MCLHCSENSESTQADEIDARIELVIDLNRRIVLLDELMMAARAKRCSDQQSESLPFVPQLA